MKVSFNLFNERNLFLTQQFTITDFKLRYSQSFLGYFWSLLSPLMMFGVLYFVFSVFMRFGKRPHYQLYLLSGIMLWTFFSEATLGGMNSLLIKASLLNKVSFPRIIIPISSILTSTITLLINIVVLFVFIFFSKVHLQLTAFTGLLIILELILIALGVSLIFSSFFLRFRDIHWIWTVILQAGFWGTPIVYPIDVVPEKYQILFKVNPMARIIMNFRAAVIYGEKISLNDIGFTWAVIGVLLALGLFAFNKTKHNLPEWV